MSFDDVSKIIGKFEGQLEAIQDNQNRLHKKVDLLHGDLNNIKVERAAEGVKIGLISAIIALGIAEGFRYWLRGS